MMNQSSRKALLQASMFDAFSMNWLLLYIRSPNMRSAWSSRFRAHIWAARCMSLVCSPPVCRMHVCLFLHATRHTHSIMLVSNICFNRARPGMFNRGLQIDIIDMFAYDDPIEMH